MLDGIDVGSHLLEVGPGAGKTTDVLREKVSKLTAVEIDPVLAAKLAERLSGTNVEVVHADATRLPFANDIFSAAASFIMLHHVPSVELQNRLLAEIARVLSPGGRFFGRTLSTSPEFREFHVDDVCVPIEPVSLPERLTNAGFHGGEGRDRRGGRHVPGNARPCGMTPIRQGYGDPVPGRS